MLRPPADLGALEPRLDQLAVEDREHLLQVALAFGLLLRDAALQLVVHLRVEEAQRVVLELALHAIDAEPVRERRVDVERLLRDLDLLLGPQVRQGAHVVRPVGQLDQDDADVPRHRQEHLAEVLRLLLLAGGEVDLADLGDAVDERGDLLAEQPLDLRQRREGVLDRVVQQTGDDARHVEPHVGDDAGDLERVGQVRLARLPPLPVVHVRREGVRALDHVEGRGGTVRVDLVDEIADGHLVPSAVAKRARARSTMALATSPGVRRSVSITRSYRVRSW